MRRNPARDTASLLDAVQAAEDALEFVQGMDRVQFHADRRTQAAVQHKLLVIGEAIKRVSDQTREANPLIPWKIVAATRDRLIHGYDSVDLDAVWTILDRDLPELLRQMEALLHHDQ